MIDCVRHPGVLLRYFDAGAGKSVMWCPQCQSEKIDKARQLLEPIEKAQSAQPGEGHQHTSKLTDYPA